MYNVTKPHFLIIEDSPTDAQELVKCLEKINSKYTYWVVPSGEEAIDFLFATRAFRERNRENVPKVIFLDLILPQMSGLEVLDLLSSYQRTRDIRKVIITESANRETANLCRKFKITAFLEKPINAKELQKVMASSK